MEGEREACKQVLLLRTVISTERFKERGFWGVQIRKVVVGEAGVGEFLESGGRG